MDSSNFGPRGKGYNALRKLGTSLLGHGTHTENSDEQGSYVCVHERRRSPLKTIRNICSSHIGQNTVAVRHDTGVFEMIVGVLTTCHTQYS